MPIKRADIFGIMSVCALVIGMALAAMSFSGSGNAGYSGPIGEASPVVTASPTETVPTPTVVVLVPTVNPDIESIEAMPVTGAGSTAKTVDGSVHTGWHYSTMLCSQGRLLVLESYYWQGSTWHYYPVSPIQRTRVIGICY